MFSSARRGQVEPLPALLALATFAIALSLYGTTLEAVPLGGEPTISEGTVESVLETLADGTVVYPDRLDRLDEADGTERRAVIVSAAGRTWRQGPRPPGDADTVRRHVLVDTSDGARPGTLRVSVW